MRFVNTPLLHGRYRLDRVLSHGRSATTWKAFDVSSAEECVVKELSVGAVVRAGSTEHSYDGDFTKVVDLFEREARVLANLDHPGIPRLLDHFGVEADGDTRLYTVQEFVEGETLESLVRGGRHFTEDEAKEICREVVSILGYLHDRSPPLVHRDVKPSNVIVSDDGAVHLVDFGAVRNVRGGDGVDGRTIVGTYGYMPMEQYEARAVPQSDYYALGMTLIYLLSHRDPTQITRTGLALDFRPFVNVSERFASLIEWMIAPAPEDRPASAARILGALDARLDNLPAHRVGSAPAPRGAGLLPVRVKASIALGFGVLAVLVALFGLLRSGVGFTEGGTAPAAARPAAAPRGAGGAGGGPAVPTDSVVPDGDVVTIDLDRDLAFVDAGFPMRRAVGQTDLPPLSRRPPPGVSLPLEVRRVDAGETYYGTIPLGNAEDRAVDYVLHDRGGRWVLWVDADDDEDLTNDPGPVGNEGTSDILAARLRLVARVLDGSGGVIERPYPLWIWFSEDARGRITGRMYGLNHYRGNLLAAGASYAVTAFEKLNHDGLYRDAGVCIDLDADERCDEATELFHDGDAFTANGRRFRLRLAYP